MKDAYGEFQGRRKAEAEASRRKRVKSWQKWETNPMNKDQGNYWRKGDMYVALNRCRDIFSYKDTPPTYLTGALPFWSERAAQFFVENANRGGITLKDAIKQARIEYGWDEATVKESLTVQQEEPVKWIERKKGERGEIGDMVTYNINVDLQDRSIMADRHILNSWCCIGGGVEKYLRAGEKVPGCLTGRVRIRYLNPEWVEWNRKNDEKHTESNQTPKPEPEPTEKQQLTAFLRVEIEKRNLRIEKMRKALNEAIKEVQAIELTIQLVEEEK